MTTDVNTRGGLEASLRAAIEGLTTSWPKGSKSITIDGVAYAIPALVKKLQGYAAAHAAVRDAKVTYEAALAARKEADPELHARLSDFHAALPIALGASSASLAKFGKAPTKPTAATKAARGPVGKKQRAKVKAPVKS
jgi:hypothetical protein